MASKTCQVERVAAVSNMLGEGIIWHPDSNSMYWLDVGGSRKIYGLCLSSGVVRSNSTDIDLYCLRVTDGQALVATTKYGLAWIRVSDLTVLGEQRILPADTRLRFNDSNCDSKGRLWTGTMVDNFQIVDGRPQEIESIGQILCIDRDIPTVVDQNYGCPNTFAWSPSDEKMYCADSVSGWIHVYDFDVEIGQIGRRRNFHLDNSRGIPDGSAIDTDGCLWNARWGGAALLRITPDGRIDAIVDIPVSRVTDCAFGGSDLSMLYVTTASYGATREEIGKQPLAGDVFSVATGVVGIDKGSYRDH